MCGVAWRKLIPPSVYSDGKYRKLNHQISNRAIATATATIRIDMYCDDPNMLAIAATTAPPTTPAIDINVSILGSKKISRNLCLLMNGYNFWQVKKDTMSFYTTPIGVNNTKIVSFTVKCIIKKA